MNKEYINMKRRGFVATLLGVAAMPIIAEAASGNDTAKSGKVVKSEAEWKKIMTPAQFSVLRDDGTERAFASPLNAEKRKGDYQCVACDLPLYTSEMKFDSGTGWPSFFTTLQSCELWRLTASRRVCCGCGCSRNKPRSPSPSRS